MRTLFIVPYIFCLQLFFNNITMSNAMAEDIESLINRIEIHIAYLHDFNATQQDSFKALATSPNFYEPNAIHFNHKLIQRCIKAINKVKSISPLFSAWDDFKNNRKCNHFSDEQVFLKEFCILMFILYNNILVKIPSKDPHKVNPTEVVHLFQTVAALPIYDFLDILDDILKEFLIVTNNYHMQPNQSFLDWLKEVWWVPPTVIAGVIAAIILHR